MIKRPYSAAGFTLIELSIVLVIIGLIVGGILVGQQLIKTAALNSILSQKQQFVTAANTFRNKYGYLPGDLPNNKSSQFGFFTFTGAAANFSIYGNGLIDNNNSYVENGCRFECGAFWAHLSDAGMLAAPLDSSLLTTDEIPLTADAGTPADGSYDFAQYLPQNKATGVYFMAAHLEDMYGLYGASSGNSLSSKTNAFFLYIKDTSNLPAPSLSPIDTFFLESKLDDGKPRLGKVQASAYDGNVLLWQWWSATVDANSDVCTFGGASGGDNASEYNLNSATGGDKKNCQPMLAF